MSVIKFPILRFRCSKYNRWMIRKSPNNKRAYCDYECGVKAQPEYTITKYDNGGMKG